MALAFPSLVKQLLEERKRCAEVLEAKEPPKEVDGIGEQTAGRKRLWIHSSREPSSSPTSGSSPRKSREARRKHQDQKSRGSRS